jgi:ferric-dicitrate binding protein FerR (iron transport regulator)
VSDARQRNLPAEVAEMLTDTDERDALESVWQALGSARPDAEVTAAESAAMWSAIRQGTVTPPDPTPSAHTPRPAAPTRLRAHARPAWSTRRVRTMALTAAGVLLVLFVGRPGRMVTVDAARGARQLVTLPDGSSVTLDAGARLQYRDGFRGWFGVSGGRATELTGAGFFDVQRGERPFTVRTYNAEVRVLGTAFSVEAWPSDASGTSVAVTEGTVQLSARPAGDIDARMASPSDSQAGETAADASITLTRGAQSRVRHAAVRPDIAASLPVERIAPWRSGGLVAVDAPLAQVTATLERQFDTRIELGDVRIGERRITLYYPTVTLERVLGDLATMQELVIERRRSGFVLREP